MTKQIEAEVSREWPDAAAGHSDGRPVAARLDDVAAWLSEWVASESVFVTRVTSNLPPTPPNFARIVDFNEAGELPTGDQTDLEAGASRCAVR
jgi:hypothetical protein